MFSFSKVFFLFFFIKYIKKMYVIDQTYLDNLFMFMLMSLLTISFAAPWNRRLQKGLEESTVPLLDYFSNAGCRGAICSMKDKDLLVHDIVMFQVIHRIQGSSVNQCITSGHWPSSLTTEFSKSPTSSRICGLFNTSQLCHSWSFFFLPPCVDRPWFFHSFVNSVFW